MLTADSVTNLNLGMIFCQVGIELGMWSNPEWTGLRGWDAKVSVMADLPP